MAVASANSEALGSGAQRGQGYPTRSRCRAFFYLSSASVAHQQLAEQKAILKAVYVHHPDLIFCALHLVFRSVFVINVEYILNYYHEHMYIFSSTEGYKILPASLAGSTMGLVASHPGQ
jgi:hypothetical protein